MVVAHKLRWTGHVIKKVDTANCEIWGLLMMSTLADGLSQVSKIKGGVDALNLLKYFSYIGMFINNIGNPNSNAALTYLKYKGIKSFDLILNRI